MTATTDEVSPRFQARMAGVFWLLTFFTGGFAMFAAGEGIMTGDAAATAARILAHGSLFRMGIAANLVATVCYLVVTVLIYQVLKPVNRSLSLVAAFFSLAGCAVSAVSFSFQLAPLVILGNSPALRVFDAEQLQAFVHLFLQLSMQASYINFLFFGLHCLLIGVLILKSTYMPRVVGALMVFAGLGWLTLSLTNLLAPPLARALSSFLLAPGIIGEGSLTLWLLFRGVNLERWKELRSLRAAYATLLAFCLVAPAAVTVAQENPLTAHNKMMYGVLKTILVRSAEKMPEEHYGFKPAETVRSYGQLVGHIADAQYRFCAKALGEKGPASSIEKTKTSKADLIAALKESCTYCDRAYNSLTDATAAEMVDLFGSNAPKFGVLNVNLVHSTEHYGNLVTYMRMKDIVPPTSEPGFMPPPKK